MSVNNELGKNRAVKISKFIEGERAKIVGTLGYVDEPLISPLTGRACAYYQITVEELLEKERTDDHVDGWYEVIREEKRLHFVLEDATGCAIIDTGAAEVSADVCVSIHSEALADPTDVELAFLATHGPRDKDWYLGKTLRYREGILEAGEFVSVYGLGHREPEPLPILHGPVDEDGENEQIVELDHEPENQLHMSGDYDEPLLVSDNRETLR